MKDDEELRLLLQRMVEDPNYDPIDPPRKFVCELCEGDGGSWLGGWGNKYQKDFRSTLYVDKEKYLICGWCKGKMVWCDQKYDYCYTYKFGSLKRCLKDRCGQLREGQTLQTVRSVNLIEFCDNPSPNDKPFPIPIS